MQCGHCDTNFVCTSTFENFAPAVPVERISNETCSLAQCYAKKLYRIFLCTSQTLFLNVFITPQFTRNSLDFTAQVEVFSCSHFLVCHSKLRLTFRRYDDGIMCIGMVAKMSPKIDMIQLDSFCFHRTKIIRKRLR